MPILLILAAAAGLFVLAKSGAATAPGGSSPSTPMTALITDPATVQGAQHIVNQLIPQLGLSNAAANAEDGNPQNAQFMANLAIMQAYIDGNPKATSALQAAGIPYPLRIDGVLDQATYKAITGAIPW